MGETTVYISNVSTSARIGVLLRWLNTVQFWAQICFIFGHIADKRVYNHKITLKSLDIFLIFRNERFLGKSEGRFECQKRPKKGTNINFTQKRMRYPPFFI